MSGYPQGHYDNGYGQQGHGQPPGHDSYYQDDQQGYYDQGYHNGNGDGYYDDK